MTAFAVGLVAALDEANRLETLDAPQPGVTLVPAAEAS